MEILSTSERNTGSHRGKYAEGFGIETDGAEYAGVPQDPAP